MDEKKTAPCIDALLGEIEPKCIKLAEDYMCCRRQGQCKYRIYFLTLPLCQFYKKVEGLTPDIKGF